MRVLLQRVKKASVWINGQNTGSIGHGVLLFTGVGIHDTEAQAEYLADKCAHLRIFSDEQGKMNRSLVDTGGSALVVSQFTLYGDCSHGRRPSFIYAAPPGRGDALYRHFVAHLKKCIPDVQTGVFGAMMDIELINDGPVTLMLEREP